MCYILLQARKHLANELADHDFPEDLRKEIFKFLGHDEQVNKIHYCAPDVAKVLSVIAPALQRINDKYANDEGFDWNIEMNPGADVRFPTREFIFPDIKNI